MPARQAVSLTPTNSSADNGFRICVEARDFPAGCDRIATLESGTAFAAQAFEWQRALRLARYLNNTVST